MMRIIIMPGPGVCLLIVSGVPCIPVTQTSKYQSVDYKSVNTARVKVITEGVNVIIPSAEK